MYCCMVNKPCQLQWHALGDMEGPSVKLGPRLLPLGGSHLAEQEADLRVPSVLRALMLRACNVFAIAELIRSVQPSNQARRHKRASRSALLPFCSPFFPLCLRFGFLESWIRRARIGMATWGRRSPTGEPPRSLHLPVSF